MSICEDQFVVLRLTTNRIPRLVLTFVILLFSPANDLSAERPNLVIILADDLGYGDPGCYNDQSRIPTPHIDRLARKGMRFTDAHTPSSVCTPTRYGLLTGRYCWRTPLKRSVLWPWDPPIIESDRLTLPRMLQSQGYATACVGKWHLGWDWPLKNGKIIRDEFSGHTIPPKRRPDFAARLDFSRPLGGGPLSRGFDYYFGDDVPNFPPYCFIENERVTAIPTVQKPASFFGHAGPAMPAWDLSVVMPTITQKAVQYIERQSPADQRPFFLYVPLTAPHTPIAPSPHFSGKSQAGRYGDFVHQVDWTVGQIVSALERRNLTDNTFLIFTSDNGSPQRNGVDMSGPIGSVLATGHDPSRPWRGMKSDAWEGGHRVPFIARWPGRIAEGTNSRQPIILTDLMRTLAAITGYDLPDNAAEDSFNVSAALFKPIQSEPIRDHLIHHSGKGVFAIRRGQWKLILGKGSGGFTRFKPDDDAPAGQLYNLLGGPGERENLYDRHPDIVQSLTQLLERAQKNGRTFPE